MNKNPEANQNRKILIIALILGVVIILGIIGIVIYVKQRERERERAKWTATYQLFSPICSKSGYSAVKE